MKPQTIARLKRKKAMQSESGKLITKKPKLPKGKSISVVRGFARAR